MVSGNSTTVSEPPTLVTAGSTMVKEQEKMVGNKRRWLMKHSTRMDGRGALTPGEGRRR